MSDNKMGAKSRHRRKHRQKRRRHRSKRGAGDAKSWKVRPWLWSWAVRADLGKEYCADREVEGRRRNSVRSASLRQTRILIVRILKPRDNVSVLSDIFQLWTLGRYHEPRDRNPPGDHIIDGEDCDILSQQRDCQQWGEESLASKICISNTTGHAFHGPV
jgi:hypothetical protein